MIDNLIAYNRRFVEEKGYEKFATTKYPDKKIAIVTCMDTRLVELLPAALGIKNGDVKLIKNAGGIITDPYDSCMRSILVAVYELGVTDVMIIAHTNCGVEGLNPDEMLHIMHQRGIPQSTIDMLRHYSGVDILKWLTGFDDTAQAVRDCVTLVKNHPLLPAGISVSGYIMDTDTGALNTIVEPNLSTYSA